jgi:hypothetical protein
VARIMQISLAYVNRFLLKNDTFLLFG